MNGGGQLFGGLFQRFIHGAARRSSASFFNRAPSVFNASAYCSNLATAESKSTRRSEALLRSSLSSLPGSRSVTINLADYFDGLRHRQRCLGQSGDVLHLNRL